MRKSNLYSKVVYIDIWLLSKEKKTLDLCRVERVN